MERQLRAHEELCQVIHCFTHPSSPHINSFRFIGAFDKPTRTLVSDFEAYGILLTTDYIAYLMLEYDALVSTVRMVVELAQSQKLAEFVDKNVTLRRLGDARKDPILSSFSKILNNSAYGEIPNYFLFHLDVITLNNLRFHAA
jgi:hypothetical protein